MNSWGLAALAAAISFLLTAVIRRYAVYNMLDVPNERSSHGVPTPRGGGLSILLSSVVCLLMVRWQDPEDSRFLVALAVGGGLVGLVGFLDDHAHVRVSWRLLAHFVAASLVIYLFADVVSLVPVPFWVAAVAASLYIVGMVNVYNFMDGIDGLAGLEAVTVCLGGILLYSVPPAPDRAWIAPLVLLGASVGFLLWNFPRARIFMGDVGSGFLGFSFALLTVEAALFEPRYFLAWFILLGAFIVDASVTLARRLVRGEKLAQAHRSHAYQRAAARYASHVVVSTAVAAINLFWLCPIALAVGAGLISGFVGLPLAYAPLLALVLFFEAGAEGRSRWP